MNIHIGKKIYAMRTAKGLTQEELAQLCCVSGAAVSKWEHDLSYPDIATLPILARIFHITIDELLNFEQDLLAEDVDRLISDIGNLFQQESFEEAMRFCKTLVYTYPNSELLKLKIAGSILQMAMLFYGQEHGEQHLEIFKKFAQEQCMLVAESKDLTMKQAACIMMSTYYMEDEPKKALKLLQSIPRLSNTISIESSLYMQMEDYDKAQELLQKQLYADSSQAIQLLYSLINIALHKQEEETARKLLSLLEQLDDALSLSSSFVHQCVYFYAKLKDREQTLRLLKQYLEQITDSKSMLSSIQTTLQNTPWFSMIKLKDNQVSEQLIKENCLQLLTTSADFDFLRNDEEFKALIQTYTTSS